MEWPVSKDILKIDIDNGLSETSLTKKYNKSKTTIRYWLKKYELETIKETISNDFRKCNKCLKEKKFSEFYIRKRNNKPYGNCKSCTNEESSLRLKDFKNNLKNTIFNILGRNCKICNKEYDSNVMDIHHLDPSKKEFNLSQVYSFSQKSIDIILKELDKCICVCANCHTEIHGGKHPNYINKITENKVSEANIKRNKRLAEIKQKCLDKVGNKCIKCGYDNYQGALCLYGKESQKDIKTRFSKFQKSYENIEKYLDNYETFCHNCLRVETIKRKNANT